MVRWSDGQMGEIFIKRDLRGLGEPVRSWGGSAFTRGFPPETKPDYVEPLWLVGSKTKP